VAVLNTIDPGDAGRSLERWLMTTLPGATPRVSDVVVPESAGFSMTTILFRADVTDGSGGPLDLVARVAPAGDSLFERPDLGREFALLRIIGEHTAVPVPKVRWLEADPSWLGGPFVVMDRAVGHVPSDDPPYLRAGWVVELAPTDRAKLFDNTLQAMVRLHAVDWSALGIAGVLGADGNGTGIADHLAALEGQYRWVRGSGAASPTIEAAFELLRDQLPPDGELVLNWGDARIGNVIFDPASVEVQALLDWEMATIASPEMDLGWFLFFERMFIEGYGCDRLPGFQRRDELGARYAALSGRSVAHVGFYEALAALRTSILLMRIGNLMIAAGAVPPDNPLPLNNPGSQILARLLDLPAPSGDAADFMASR